MDKKNCLVLGGRLVGLCTAEVWVKLWFVQKNHTVLVYKMALTEVAPPLWNPLFSPRRRRLKKSFMCIQKWFFYTKTHIQTWCFVILKLYFSIKQLRPSNKWEHQITSFNEESFKPENMPLAKGWTKIITRRNDREHRWDSIFSSRIELKISRSDEVLYTGDIRNINAIFKRDW